MKTYKAALIGCSRMGAFIDNEVTHGRPYSHAAGYEACERTELIACSDVRIDVMERAGERYGIPKKRQYTDYRELIEREQPDILSVTTQAEQRAEIVIYAADHGVKAIFAEKPMAASLAEADAMVEACERNRVVFNLGSLRRWEPCWDRMKELIDGGRIGALRTLIVHQVNPWFNMGSHWFDLLLRLNGDRPVSWVRAEAFQGGDQIEGDLLRADIQGHGVIGFENGVMAYALNTGRGYDVEAIGETGSIAGLRNGEEWQLREPGGKDHRGADILVFGEFPTVEPKSPTVCLIEDTAHALDTGEPTRGGVRIARAGHEVILAFVESHQRGGARVDLPLTNSRYRLARTVTPRQPKLEPWARA